MVRETALRILQDWLPDVQIISGGARGADALGERFAQEHGLDLLVMPADWEKHGCAAGLIRNKQMARLPTG